MRRTAGVFLVATLLSMILLANFVSLAATNPDSSGRATAAPVLRPDLLGLNLNTVTFSEVGLPLLTTWSVTLHGSTSTVAAGLVNSFLVASGNYSYQVGRVAGYTATPSSGLIVVTSLTTTLSVTFQPASPAKYNVTFLETGLPSGTSWSVVLNGTRDSASAPSPIQFSEPNGSYSYSIGNVTGYTASPSSGTISVQGGSVGASATFGADIQHVVVLVLENQAQSAVMTQAPYQEYLANTYARATSFYSACHYSLSDYAAMTSGRTYVCGSGSIPIENATNLADLLQSHSLSWMGYFEGMANPCQFTSSGSYVSYHNPFILYKDIRYNTTRCDAHIVNSAQFNSSVDAGTLPAFSYYVPNTHDDCYVTNLTFCDHWLRNFLSPILNSTNATVQQLVSTTAFFVVYDEAGGTGTTFYGGYSAGGVVNSWCRNVTGQALSVCGGQVYLTVVSPWSKGRTYASNASLYNLESTVEWLFGLGSDGGYDGTSYFPAMTGLFSFSQNGVVTAISTTRVVPGGGMSPNGPSFGSLGLLGALGTLAASIGAVIGFGRRTLRLRGVDLAGPHVPRESTMTQSRKMLLRIKR